MKYKQQKNKIAKLFGKSQENKSEFSKKRNEGLVPAIDTVFKKPYSFTEPIWQAHRPTFLDKGNPDVVMLTEGYEYWIMDLKEIQFSQNVWLHLQLRRGSDLIIDRKIIPEIIYEYDEWSGEYYVVGYRYTLTSDEFNEIHYTSSFSWRMRQWVGAVFLDWSEWKSFTTMPYIPPRQLNLHLNTIESYFPSPEFQSQWGGRWLKQTGFKVDWDSTVTLNVGEIVEDTGTLITTLVIGFQWYDIPGPHWVLDYRGQGNATAEITPTNYNVTPVRSRMETDGFPWSEKSTDRWDSMFISYVDKWIVPHYEDEEYKGIDGYQTEFIICLDISWRANKWCEWFHPAYGTCIEIGNIQRDLIFTSIGFLLKKAYLTDEGWKIFDLDDPPPANVIRSPFKNLPYYREFNQCYYKSYEPDGLAPIRAVFERTRHGVTNQTIFSCNV